LDLRGINDRRAEKIAYGGLQNLYSSSNIKMIISGRMRWAWHVTRTGEMIKITKFW
jgi:hypothetical protein